LAEIKQQGESKLQHPEIFCQEVEGEAIFNVPKGKTMFVPPKIIFIPEDNIMFLSIKLPRLFFCY
jgi:hypothetical protein